MTTYFIHGKHACADSLEVYAQNLSIIPRMFLTLSQCLCAIVIMFVICVGSGLAYVVITCVQSLCLYGTIIYV